MQNRNKLLIKKSLSPDGIDRLNLSQSSRGTIQGTELGAIVDRFLFTNMKTRRLQHSTTAHE
jgi:hypothetical protein